MIESGELLTRNVPSSLILYPDVAVFVNVQFSLNVNRPDWGLPPVLPVHLQGPNMGTPSNCVPQTGCCNDDGGIVGVGNVVGCGFGDEFCDGAMLLYAARMPPTATMTAATPVRMPGKDVQNDFLLSSPTANSTLLF